MIDYATRRYALGGTDIAALFDASPFRSQYDVWLEKTGQLAGMPRNGNNRATWGKRLERVIAEAYTETTGRPHQWLDKTLPHPRLDIGCWTPDALLTQDNGGLDAKSCAPDQIHNWGDPMAEPDSVPDYIALQCQFYMSASERDYWDIALLVGGSDLRVYRVQRDREMEALILEHARAWWDRHVIGGEAPTMTATNTAAMFLKHKYPRNSGTLRVPTGEEAELIEDFLDCRTQLKQLESEYDDYEIKLKAAIGADSGFRLHNGRITFNRTKDHMGTDFESLARWAAADDYERLAKQFYGVRREGSRRMDVRVKGGE